MAVGYIPTQANVIFVETAAERLALHMKESRLVVQRDTGTMYRWDIGTLTWIPIYTNHVHANQASLDVINQNLATTDSPHFNVVNANEFRVDTITYINSTTVQIGDNLIVLNAGETGSPSLNAGIEIERGTSTNTQLLWNETTDRWQAGVVGSLADVLLSTDKATISGTANRLSVSGGTNAALAAVTLDVNTSLLPSPTSGDTGKALVSSGANTASWVTISVADEKVKVSATDTTPAYLDTKLVVSHGTNSTNPLELSTLLPAGVESRQLQLDVSKINHNGLLNYVANEHIDWTGDRSATHTIATANVELPRVASSTYKHVGDLFNLLHCTGWISGGTVTDAGSGKIDVSSGTGLIRIANTETSDLRWVDWATTTGITLTDLVDNYVYVAYNTGSPLVSVSTTEPTDHNTNIQICKVFRSGTTLHIVAYDKVRALNPISRISDRWKATRGVDRASGAMIAATGTRAFSLTSGSFWYRLENIITSSFDCAAADRFTYWYRANPTGWTSVATQAQIDNTQYDDGSGVLATLSTPSRYGVHWVYASVGDTTHVDVLYGQGDYTLTTAQGATPPTTLPPSITSHGVLVGKIIINKSAAVFTSIQTPFTSTFSATVVSNHNDLGGIQGGAANDYYHLTASQATVATQAATSLLNGYLSSADWTTFNNKQNALTNPITGTGATGQVAYFNGTTTQTGHASFIFDATNVRLGLGATTPSYGLHCKSANLPEASIGVDRTSGSADAPGRVLFKRSRGTYNAAVQNGDTIGTINWAAHDGATYQDIAMIGCYADATVGANDMPGRLVFSVVPDGTKTLAEAMRINNAGSLGLGTTSPTRLLGLGGDVARSVGMERHTTTNTAGNSLTLNAGGATSGATDKDGGILYVSPGTSTGTGGGCVRTKRNDRALSTGTADNAQYDAILVCPPKHLSDNVAAGIVDIDIAAGVCTGGTITYMIEATDGTDFQSHAGIAMWAAVNKGGTITSNVGHGSPASGLEVDANSAGSMTDTWTVVHGTNKITLTLNANTTLASPTDIKVWCTVHNDGRGTVTVL